jgi:hypothetical protein
MAKLAELEAAIAGVAVEEVAMNEKLFDLYGLTDDERYLVHGGSRAANQA